MTNRRGSELPLASVIIPCRNEARFISRCLDSVVFGSAGDVEILVIDGESEDGTQEIVRRYAAAHPQIRLLSNPRRVTPAALNIGLRAARANVIIRMDAHATFPVDFVTVALKQLDATDAWAVGGPIETVSDASDPIARAIAMMTASRFGVGDSKFRTQHYEGYVDTVPFGAYRREVFARVGPFDETLVRNQDNELSSRIISAGGRIFMTPALTAQYYARSDLFGILSQAFRTGMWNAATIRRNRKAFALRHFIPFAFVTGLTMSTLLAVAVPMMFVLPAAILLLYGGAASAAAVQTGKSRHDAAATILPLLFFAYHATYGAGTWAGLFRVIATNWPPSESTDHSIESTL